MHCKARSSLLKPLNPCLLTFLGNVIVRVSFLFHVASFLDGPDWLRKRKRKVHMECAYKPKMARLATPLAAFITTRPVLIHIRKKDSDFLYFFCCHYLICLT